MHNKLRLFRLSLSFWASGNSLNAWALTLSLVTCTISIVLINMLLNKWQVGFYSQLQQYNFTGFIDSLMQFIILAIAYVFMSGCQSQFRMSLEMHWRCWLTDKFISLWLKNQTYYHLNLTDSTINSDQHISEDIRLFLTNTIDLAIGLLRHIVMLLVFSIILWQLSGIITVSILNYIINIPGYLFWLALLYSVLGTVYMIKVGKPLIALNFKQQSNEAEFRSCLKRIKEHDECVALYAGEKIERQNLIQSFQKIMYNYFHLIKATRLLTFISSAYSQLSMVFAFLIASPRYFSNDLQLGQLFEISGAYWYVHSALSYLIDSFEKIALWKAVASRLDNFSLHMSETSNLGNTNKDAISFTKANHIKLKKLTVFSPTGQSLLNNLSIDLSHYDKLLITGPIGSGKTTLLRTIAGIWPYFSGTIIKPKAKSIMFMPQKTYVPPGSLRNALLYPNFKNSLSDKYLNEILKLSNLSMLTGKLDQVEEWDKILSLGEQQCLAFSRAILQRPEWLFLDEATSNMDKITEQSLYLLLEEILPTTGIVSVGHREALRPFHTLNLIIEDSGNWYTAALETPRLTS